MDAIVSVDLRAEGACLEVPWQGGKLWSYDLKRHSDPPLQAPASHNCEMAEFVAAMNSALSMLEIARCGTWLSDQMEGQEAIYAATWKFGSHVDLLFADCKARSGFAAHENFANRIARLLQGASDIPAAAEFIVRRCRYAGIADGWTDANELADGFFLTFYLFGYGENVDEARRRWGIALKVVENALLQLSAMHRRGSNQTDPPPPETMHAVGGI